MGGFWFINRFEDPQVEARYVHTERERRRPAIRAVIWLGVGLMFTYILVVPFLFPNDDPRGYTLAAGFFIAVLLAYLPYLGTSLYVRFRWADLPWYVLLGAAMYVLNAAIIPQADALDVSPLSISILNFVLLAFYASVGFVAAEAAFLVFAALLWVAMLGYLVSHGAQPQTMVYAIGNFSSLLFLAVYGHWEADRRARNVFISNRMLEAERAKSDSLLHNVLPSQVALRLREGEAVADAYSDLTVIFVDLVGFTPLTRRLAPGHLVDTLNRFFVAADECAEQHGVEKVKTIGDAYLAVVGGTASRDAGPSDAVAFVLSLQAQLTSLAEETGIAVSARAGIHTGPGVGGVTGSRRLAYDYWGDTVNIASRIESCAEPGGLAVSEATHLLVRAEHDFAEPIEIDLKGLGKTKVYRMMASKT